MKTKGVGEFITPNQGKKLGIDYTNLKCYICRKKVTSKQSLKQIGDKTVVHKKCFLQRVDEKPRVKFDRDMETAEQRLDRVIDVLHSINIGITHTKLPYINVKDKKGKALPGLLCDIEVKGQTCQAVYRSILEGDKIYLKGKSPEEVQNKYWNKVIIIGFWVNKELDSICVTTFDDLTLTSVQKDRCTFIYTYPVAAWSSKPIMIPFSPETDFLTVINKIKEGQTVKWKTKKDLPKEFEKKIKHEIKQSKLF